MKHNHEKIEITLDGISYKIGNPEPMGREVLVIAGKTPDKYLLSLIVPNAPNRLVDPDETIDLTNSANRHFDLIESARHYSFRVDEQSFDTTNPNITGRELLELVGKCPATHQLTFQIIGPADEFIEANESAELERAGREQFFSVLRMPLTITIDGASYQPGVTEITGDKLRHLVTPPISDAKDLWFDVPGKEDLLVKSGDRIALKDGMAFYSAARVGLTLTFVVNGASTEVPVSLDDILRDAAMKALKATGNEEGRPIEEWDLKDSEGAVIDMSSHVEAHGFTSETKLYLSPKIGAGGCDEF